MATQPSRLFYARSGGTNPLYAAINSSSSGNNTVVASVAGQQIVILSYTIVASGSVTVTWESGSGSVLGGPMAIAANGGVSTTYNPTAHFVTAVGESLLLNLSGATQVGGHLEYILT